MWHRGVSERGGSTLLDLLHTVFTWIAPRLHLCLSSVVAG